jgi:2,4-dienoyl-CoA reductase-like NADH-dependent reductase (Old Yellow Enzyme family)
VTYEHLFRPGQLGTLSVRNRVVMAPIDSVLRTEDGASTPAHAAYLAARAAGGVGLIICDNLIVEWPRGSVGSKSLRLDQDRFIASLNEMVEEVHYWGAAIVAQINHAGRQTTLGGSQGIGLVSPSPIAWPDSGTIPRELSKSDIRAMVDLFVAAARRARMARFDGVQIHAAHGYLLASFLSPALNQRTDEYGGSTANSRPAIHSSYA